VDGVPKKNTKERKEKENKLQKNRLKKLVYIVGRNAFGL